MSTLLKKCSPLLSVISFLVLLILTWMFSLVGLILGIIFLLFSLVIHGLVIVKKHKAAFIKGEISRIIFLRNTILEILYILLTIVLASLLARYVAKIATEQIDNFAAKFIAGICLGMLVGIAAGLLMKRISERLGLLFSNI